MTTFISPPLCSCFSLWRRRDSRRHSWPRNYNASVVLSPLLGLRLSSSLLVPLASVPLRYLALFANTRTTVSTSVKIWSRLSLTTCPRSPSSQKKVVTLPTRPLTHQAPPSNLLTRPLAPSPLPRPWSSLEMQVFIPLIPPPLYTLWLPVRFPGHGIRWKCKSSFS